MFPGQKIITGWFVVIESILILAFTLKCYPLAPLTLISIEIILLKLTTFEILTEEVRNNFSLILMLIFAIAPIYFHKNIINFIFNKIIVKTKSKIVLSVFFLVTSAFLSAFLNALTVVAIIVTICSGLYGIYTEYYKKVEMLKDSKDRLEKRQFGSFLRSILMHSAIGTAVGGVSTMIGEPQNFLIAKTMNWSFKEFFINILPVSASVLVFAILVCIIVEKYKLFGFGTELPKDILEEIKKHQENKIKHMGDRVRVKIIFECISLICFIGMLAIGTIEVGIAGLIIIGFINALSGNTKEEEIGKAFESCIPFTGLIILFFVISSMIEQSKLFEPIINFALSFHDGIQKLIIFISTGILSSISDNVFVATIYIGEISKAFSNGLISLEQFNSLGKIVNVATNITSMATPNGQAAFLFLLTSYITQKIYLNYSRMVVMAIPYTIVLSTVAIIISCFL